ncbi:unnamed protein product [Microthlaspi erraticum]|uniref:RIN4 pathogenic type III effector avirulence factor Avr cleavage site domain-containing protein n=1 Tax=Microthlaspi erraticum TaxID=1685480 RepID=A0A6D2KPV2_9BRAS|nr:unnamed protein product [Microthlaspi erraticum]
MAANRPNIPKFGDWTEDAPFTVVFDKASRSKKNTTNVSNPNEYPDMNPNPAPSRNQRHDQQPNHNVRPRHERLSSREETELRPFSQSHNERNMRARAPPTPETYNHQSYGGGGRSAGNLLEANRRQPHDPPQVQPRPIRNLRGRSSERVATIPPFPGSGSDQNQSYTLIFDKVKEDRKQSGTVRSYNGTAQSTPSRTNDQHHQPLPSSPKGCCFPPWK